jgi:hypothetical protein
MRVRHPYALDDGPPAPDARVHYGGRRETAEVDADGIFDVPDDSRARLELWAEGYGYDLAELIVNEDAGAEICGTEKADGTVCERPADECPYHGEKD